MNISYIIKHWFSILLIGPFLADILNYYYTDQKTLFHLLAYFPAPLFFGLFFSIPTYVLIIFIFKFLEKKNYPILVSKSILIFVSISGIIISINLLFNKWQPNTILAYALTSVFFGYFYNLEKSNNDND